MPTALLFPGQGAPAADWAAATRAHRPDLVRRARELLDGTDPFDGIGGGTEYDQPAIYCASLAAFDLAGRPRAALHAGHSLGEIAALACAGAISDADGLVLVVERGRLMATAAARAGGGAMLAVGVGADELASLTGDDDLAIANLNAPAQTVLTGTEAAVTQVAERLRERGVRTKRLAVAGAFHSPAMAPAAAAFADALARVEVREPSPPVLTGRTGRPFADVRAELAASLVEPVRWIDVVAALERAGIDRCVEIGPGKALCGLVRRSAAGPIATEPSRPPQVLAGA